MIVKMRKVSVLLHHKAREEFLAGLQEVGVVHVTENPDKDAVSMHKRIESIKETEKVCAGLKKAAAVLEEQLPQKNDQDAGSVMRQFHDRTQRIDALDQGLQRLQKDEAVFEPWGEFDPTIINKLQETGISVRFFQAPEKKFNQLDPSGFLRVEISRVKGQVFFVIVAQKNENTVIDADEIRLPAGSLRNVRDANIKAIADKNTLGKELQALSAYSDVLRAHANLLQDQHCFLSAGEDLVSEAQGKLLMLTGFFPAGEEKAVKEYLEKRPVWFEISEPAATDSIPVLLKNGWFARKFEPVLSMLSLPSYYEIDPVPFFAPFLVLFIGLCLGDVGYGSLLLIASIAGLFKAPKKFKPVFETTTVISAVVIFAGVLLNSFFGLTLFAGPGIPAETAIFSNGAQWFCPLSPFASEKGTIYPMMSFAIVLGMVQVFLAIALRAVNAVRQNTWVHGIYPLSFFPIFGGFLVIGAHTNLFGLNMAGFAVNQWKVGALWMAVPATAGWAMFFGGIALFMLFNKPGTKIFMRPLRGLWEAFNFITGMLSSILSYLRLFALGLASGLLGSSFNNMAVQIVSSGGSPDWTSPMAVAAVLLLVVGHSVNLGLSIISAIIHPLRLTFVEFIFSNLGFAGGGKAYNPLKKLTQSS